MTSYSTISSAYETGNNRLTPYQKEIILSMIHQEETDSEAPIFVIDDYGYDSSEIILLYHSLRNLRDLPLAVDGDKGIQDLFGEVFFMQRDYFKTLSPEFPIAGVLLLNVEKFGDHSPFLPDHSKWDAYIAELRRFLKGKGHLIIHAQRPEGNAPLIFPDLDSSDGMSDSSDMSDKSDISESSDLRNKKRQWSYKPGYVAMLLLPQLRGGWHHGRCHLSNCRLVFPTRRSSSLPPGDGRAIHCGHHCRSSGYFRLPVYMALQPIRRAARNVSISPGGLLPRLFTIALPHSRGDP